MPVVNSKRYFSQKRALEFESWEPEEDYNPGSPVLPLGSYSYSVPKAELVVISSDDEDDVMQVS